MLRRDVTFEDFAHRDWLALMSLVGRYGERPEPARQGLVLLVDGDQVLKVFGTQAGRVDPAEVDAMEPLADIAERYEARWVLRLGVGALEELADRFARRLRQEHDLIDQAFELLRSARELELEGRLSAWPRSMSSIPLVGDAVVERALDLVCPDGKSMMLGAFTGGHVATCLVMHRRGRGFDRLVGPEQLRRDMGLSTGDFARDGHRLARAAELAVGPLSLGCFAEVPTWRRLLRDRAPGAWATAVATREVVMHPLGPAVAVPLGMDVGRVAYHTMRGIAHRLGSGTGAAVFGPALSRVRAAFGGPIDELGEAGISTLRMLKELLDRERE